LVVLYNMSVAGVRVVEFGPYAVMHRLVPSDLTASALYRSYTAALSGDDNKHSLVKAQ